MSASICLGFPHSYRVELPQWLPPPGDREPVVYGGKTTGGYDGMFVRVVPDQAPSWFGVFAFR